MFEKSKEAKAIYTIAKHHSLSEGKIKEEMQHAIDMAMEKDNFVGIFGKDARPSPEEFIRIISDTINMKLRKS